MSLICMHGRIAPDCHECDAERGNRAARLTAIEILRELWRGCTLVAWWPEWPDGSTRPNWTGCLRAPDGTSRELDSPTALTELLEDRLIDRRNRLQKRGERREWRLSDRGLAALGLPSAAQMKRVERREKVLSA